MARRYKLSGGRRAFNAVMKGLVGLGVSTGATCLLTTMGHRSGQPRTTPVSVVIHHGRRWLVAPYGTVGWVKNVRATGRATLKCGRKSESIQLHEVAPEEAAPILKKYLERYRIVAPFFNVRAGEPVERFVREAQQRPVFEVRLA